MSLGAIWIVFSLSFVMSLSGALMPGPLLTYTIARTVQTGRKGYLVGPLVILGHAALETLIVFGLVLGIAQFLTNPLVLKIIGTLGGLLLMYMGVGLIREAFRGGADDPFASAERDGKEGKSLVGRMSPVVAGIVVSMSNPYWWIWWVTVGSATMIRFDVTLRAWQGLLAFFIGHEAGDFAWYTAISTLTHLGRRAFSRGVYKAVLAVCGIAIIGFGAYLGISLFVPSR